MIGAETLENVYGRTTLSYCDSSHNVLYAQPYLNQLTSKILT